MKRTEAKIGDPSEKVKSIVAMVMIFIPVLVIVAVASKHQMTIIAASVTGPILVLAALFYIYDLRAGNKNDEEVKEVAILRRNAAGPSAALNLPAQLQERLNKRRSQSRNTINDAFNDSPAYYEGASACGVSPYTYSSGGAALGDGAGAAGDGGDGDW